MADDDYKSQVVKLQEALIEGRIDNSTYERLKADLDHPKSNPTTDRANSTTHSTQKKTSPKTPEGVRVLFCFFIVVGCSSILDLVSSNVAAWTGGGIAATIFFATGGTPGKIISGKVRMPARFWGVLRSLGQTLGGIGVGGFWGGCIVTMLIKWLGLAVPVPLGILLGSVVLGLVCFVKPDALERIPYPYD
jgi:hypothetical protein